MSNIYVFSSENLTNVWAGIGAKLWAISEAQGTSKKNITKSKNIQIGAFGIFYIKEIKSFTTPFIIRSKPTEGAPEINVWSHAWYLPFSILPFGTPYKSIRARELNSLLPSLIKLRCNWDRLLFVSPNTVFAPAKITAEDWAILMEKLVEV